MCDHCSSIVEPDRLHNDRDETLTQLLLSHRTLQAIGTPVVGDFNADSHLEVSYSVVWQAALYGAAPVTKVFTFTLKDRFKELYQLHGEVKGQELVNFDLLLPSDWQPWNKYMGRYGNNRFKAGIDDL